MDNNWNDYSDLAVVEIQFLNTLMERLVTFHAEQTVSGYPIMLRALLPTTDL